MALLDSIRKVCPEALWTRGVNYAREGLVHTRKQRDGEVELQVALPGGARAFTVSLWPEDELWACDCESSAEACAHAAAAVIAWTQAAARGATPQAGMGTAGKVSQPTRAPATLRYHLRRVPTDPARKAFAWRVDRVAIRLGDEEQLRGPLRGRSAGDALVFGPGDMALEDAIIHRWGQIVPREVSAAALSALAECAEVLLDGKPVPISARPVLPILIVDDDPADKRNVRLRAVRDPGITEVFTNGSVICGGELRPVGDGGLSLEKRTQLNRGLTYGPSELGRLVSETLPSLRASLPLQILTERLPREQDSRPRLLIETRQQGESLLVTPLIVYGDPPVARVERGELQLLGKRIPVRDRRAEERLQQRVNEELRIPVGLASDFSGERAVSFVDRLQGFPADRQGEAWQRWRRGPALSPHLAVDGLRLDLSFGGADPEAVIAAWRSGAGLVQGPEGWSPLPLDWLARYGHLVADLLAARQPDGPLRKAALFDLARLAQSLDQPMKMELGQLRALLGDFTALPTAPLPSDLRAELRPYQRAGVNWICFLREAGLGGILADDMGLGKTLQALAALRGRTLVVAPTSVLFNWEREARRFRPGLKVALYHGPQRRLAEDADLVITSYGLLRLDIAELEVQRWDNLILDEAQAIKNPESQAARAAFRLPAAFRLAMTGTPVENRLEELWSQLHFANQGLLGGRGDFAERYSKPISQGEAGAAARLRARIQPFVLRRKKQQVAADLPPRTDMVLSCELSEAERSVYDAVRQATRASVVEQLGQNNTLAALEALLRLRQAACHSGLLPGQSATSSSKVELLVEHLEEATAEGHKALVFSQWTEMLDRIEPALRGAGLPFVRLDGSTRDRGAVVERFQAADGPPVFLISLKAGGVGLNLTAADHVYLVDPWWNPAVEDQAADRAHRIGQDRPVMVYRLVAQDTVEERILDLQERKRSLAEAALGGADRAASITREELMALLD